MDETIKQEEVKVCQACNKVIENPNMWETGNSIVMVLNGKELARMHFDCYTKGCLWAAKQANEEANTKKFVANYDLGIMAKIFK